MRKNLTNAFKKALVVTLSVAVTLTSVTIPVNFAKAEETEVTENEDFDEELQDFIVTKISNPDAAQGDVDGLVDGGNRENSYAWCMTSRGDKVYIGTNKGLGSSVINSLVVSLVKQGMEKEKAEALVDTITNYDFDHTIPLTGGDIISYDTKTGEMKVLYTAGAGVSFRMAIEHKGNVFIGSYAGDTCQVLMIDDDDNVDIVYETEKGTSMRAACVFEDELYFGGVDSKEELNDEYEGAAKLAIMKMDNSDPTKWERVADFKDFDVEYATDPAMKNGLTSPIWDIVSYDGYIYATLPNAAGFIVYKGHPAADDETANEYGWYWEEVVGDKNGINNKGLCDEEGGYTDELKGASSIVATPFVFKDKLYLMDFDNTLGSMTNAAKAFMGGDMHFSDAIRPMYNSLKHSQKLWVLDNETGEFNEVSEFCELMEDTCNEYLWRTAVYDDELYITTMDASVIYKYLTKYTNLSLDAENMQDKVESIKNIAHLMQVFDLDESENENIRKIATLIIKIAEMLENAESDIDEDEAEDVSEDYDETVETLKSELKTFKKAAIKKDNVKKLAKDIEKGDSDNNDTINLLAALNGDEDGEDVVDDIIDDDAEISTSAAIIISIIQNIQEIIENVKTSVQETIQSIQETLASIDWEAIYMYAYIANVVNNTTSGFDMYKTADGESFTLITDDGFGDKYNYGGRTLEATDTGLYVGTANPFYGAQLFNLKNVKEEPADIEPSTPATEASVTTPDAVTPSAVAPDPATPGAVTPDPVTPSITLKKSKVVLAPSKSTTVGYTVKPATYASVTAVSANKKLVTASVKNGKITVKATKAAAKKKGTIVKVTVKAGDNKKVLNVAIRNNAKKIKAKKKNVTVKKGKALKVVFKVTKAENKKKAITNAYAVNAKKFASIKKIAKVKSVTVRKGKVIVKIKATKKGKKKLTLKFAKKVKANVTVKVK